ncbi:MULTISPECIES: ROK family transcriptional regulator [unclassified Mesorhizobium]|uniref:ROK family transcriptional regulator n=1 Tax=unclassified Mesorhizobium TaxID=325217 RepID=UPI000FCA047A|nr:MULTISPECIES: ROK family transcriptional regulator [unclassified Mesorhizobium]WIE89268.1 ROK family transcriptional regulator [Mesorhizobium sp. WSM4875]MDG4852074.1 ROK family transcriptional regulator [Mesorhizobium sp. WSM4982]MDG4902472.1 ROK family transcriptional regulator [Mesorhizobium sp. WSM4962]MDG4911214.1 ROK family transcriptional regulator [Mesorhizobium sp. WSM4983]MDG4920480.1 ROK family transcriptional regulator [Mesorhizobium sp. WSM4989]
MALRGTNQEFGRPYNRRIVLESIRRFGPIARGDIAQHVGLTVQTVSTIVRELEEQGYILSVREEPKGRGQPPATLRINPEGGYAVGIHLTPLGIDAALINLSGDVIESVHREAPSPTPDLAFEAIGAMVADLTGRRAGGRVIGVGMALPGPFGVESMSFVGPTTMAGWKGVPLRERLAAATGLPAFFETDMAAAAMGERLYGLGLQRSDYYYLYFSVGLGGAMVHDGGVLRGAWGNAGEIGHIPVVPEGELCPCGNRGCLERYLSLEARGRWNGNDAGWVAEVAPIFRNAIAVIENLFDPETIVLGGLASPQLLERLAALAEPLHNSVSARKDRAAPRILVAQGGQHAVLRGAAALAVSGVLSPRFGQIFTAKRQREGDLLNGGDIAA